MRVKVGLRVSRGTVRAMFKMTASALALTVSGMLLPHAAIAQTSTSTAARVAFDMPARDLNSALLIFTQKAGLQVVYDADKVTGKHSSAVSGHLTPVEALSQLLVGTGLTFRFTGGNKITLEQAPQSADGTIQLGPVRVEGEGGDTRSAVYAQTGETTSNAPMKGYVARRSTTGSKTDTPVLEVPQSISIVTRDSLDVRATSSIAEALEYTPGITTTFWGGDDRYDWMTTRGIGQTYGQTYRDGLRTAGWNYAVARTEAYGAERVEYLRGPASILFGGNIPGGVVNIVTKRPTEEARGEVRLRAGSRNRFDLAGDVSGPLTTDGALLYRFVVSRETYDLLPPESSNNRFYVAPALTFRPGPDTEITLLGSYQRERMEGSAYPARTSEILRRAGSLLTFQKGFDALDRDQYDIGLIIDQRISDNVGLHSRVRYNDVKFDYRYTNNPRLVGPDTIRRGSTNDRDRAQAWTADTYADVKWSLGSFQNTTIAGIDFRSTKGNFRTGYAPAPFLNIVTGETQGQFIRPVPMPARVGDERQVGIYLQNQLKVGERLVIVAGGRQDWFRSDVTGAWVVDPDVRQNAFSGRLGAVWLFPAGFAPYVSYSTSFEPQSGGDRRGRSFVPTTGRQFEAGLRYEPDNANLRLSAAIFDLRQRNVLAPDPVNEMFSIQRGEMTSRGVELEANASLADGLSLLASYTFTDVKTTKDSNPTVIGTKAPLVPRHRSTIWADYRFTSGPLNGLGAGLGVRYNSETPGYGGGGTVPDVTLFDARLAYGIDRWELAVNARNLFDKDYLLNCQNFVSGNFCALGNPREVIGTLTYRW